MNKPPVRLVPDWIEDQHGTWWHEQEHLIQTTEYNSLPDPLLAIGEVGVILSQQQVQDIIPARSFFAATGRLPTEEDEAPPFWCRATNGITHLCDYQDVCSCDLDDDNPTKGARSDA